jgi:hypothetical protein
VRTLNKTYPSLHGHHRLDHCNLLTYLSSFTSSSSLLLGLIFKSQTWLESLYGSKFIQ